MPQMGRAEGQIFNVEGFKVLTKWANTRGAVHRKDVPAYPYHNAAPGDWTVAKWREQRFELNYPGFTVVVLDGRGRPVDGHVLLSNLRATYE